MILRDVNKNFVHVQFAAIHLLMKLFLRAFLFKGVPKVAFKTSICRRWPDVVVVI